MAKKSKYYVRPDGMHEAIRKINGKRVAFRGKSDREVEQKMRDYKEEMVRGRKLDKIAREWLKSRESECTDGTLASYNRVTKALCTAFPGKYASEITPMMLQKYIAGIAKTRKKSTAAAYLAPVKMIFRFAVVSGDISTSPATEVMLPKSSAPVVSHPPLTEEQENAVIAWEKGRKSKEVSLWFFLLFSGLRRGEALALTYADIDRDAGCIHITKKINYLNSANPKRDDFLKSKNGKRDIPLFRPLADRLPKNRVGLIFPGKNGGLMSKAELDAGWRKFTREIGFSETVKNSDGSTSRICKVTPHSFRHTFATICYEQGIDSRQAARLLGDTEATTEGVYTHLRNNRETEAWEAMQGCMEEKFSSSGR